MVGNVMRREVVASELVVGQDRLSELDQGPVCFPGVDEGLLPFGTVEGNPEQRDPVILKLVHRPGEIGDLQGDVVHPFAPRGEETADEANGIDRRDELDLAARREAELCPSEPLRDVVSGEQERRTQSIYVDAHRIADASHCDGDMIQLRVEHGRESLHAAKKHVRRPRSTHDSARCATFTHYFSNEFSSCA